MARRTDSRRADPEDVLRGRVRPGARELVELIRSVNPTGLGLSAAETTKRYAWKSRLQSLLVERFADDIDVRREPGDERVVSLRHRPSGLDACHAVIAELHDDARSWVQRAVDLLAAGDEPDNEPVAAPKPARGAPGGGGRPAPVSGEEASVEDLVRAAEEALEAYDYDGARTLLERAASLGAPDAGARLLALLVETLGADDEALALAATLAPSIAEGPDVRALVALASARLGRRDRAAALADTLDGRRAADVFVALARVALGAGDLAQAAADRARAQRCDPAHQDLAGLEDALSQRRAEERAPLEAEARRLLEAGSLDEAVACASALLARWPDSAAARRILCARDERDRARRAAALAREAEDALARSEGALALARFSEALAAGLEGDVAARAEARIATLRAEARAREEQEAISDVVRRLDEDLAAGLRAYLRLDPQLRREVRAARTLRELAWLEETGASGAGAAARAAVAAVQALGAVSEKAASQPERALDQLAAHAKALQGVRDAQEAGETARRALSERRRGEADKGLDALLTAWEAADLALTTRLLSEVKARDLAPERRALLERLRERIRADTEIHTLTGLAANEKDPLRARRIYDELMVCLAAFRDRAAEAAGRSGTDEDGETMAKIDAEIAAFEATRTELARLARARFSVRDFGAPLGSTRGLAGLDGRCVLRHVLRTLLPNGDVVFAQTRGASVFVRVLDAAAGRLRARAKLTLPEPLQLVWAEIVDGNLLRLVGQRGRLLEVAIGSWDVVRWVVPPFPAEQVHDAAMAPGGRFLWLSAGDPAEQNVRVLDLERSQVVREHREGASQIALTPLQELREPRVVGLRVDSVAVLWDPRGAPVGAARLALRAIHRGVVTHPARDAILALEQEQSHDFRTVALRWVEVGPDGIRLSGVDGAGGGKGSVHQGPARDTRVEVAIDSEAGMAFVLVEEDEGVALLAFRSNGVARGAGVRLDLAYRARVPESTFLVQDPHGTAVAAVSAHGADDIYVVRLRAEPPAFPSSGSPAAAVNPLDVMVAHLWLCHRPVGPTEAAMLAFVKQMKAIGPSAATPMMDAVKQEPSPSRVLALAGAFEICGLAASAARLLKWAWARFPDAPELRVSRARSLAGDGCFDEIVPLLADLDAGSLDAAAAQHRQHLLALALLWTNRPDEALLAIEAGSAIQGGHCYLGGLRAIATPLPDGVSEEASGWTTRQAALRRLLAAVREADRRLERGDAQGARLALERHDVCGAHEVQSLARLAEAYMLEGDTPATDRFAKAFALSAFFDAHERRGPLIRRELPLGVALWPVERLDEVAVRAATWLLDEDRRTEAGGAPIAAPDNPLRIDLSTPNRDPSGA